MKAVVINYGVGNLFSIVSSLRKVGFDIAVMSFLDRNWKEYNLVVFPGVGTFNAVSMYIRRMAEVFEEAKEAGVWFLGTCLGMQIMFEYGFEGGFHKGLGWFKGYVDRLVTDLKLPHIGWNRIYTIKNANSSCEIFSGISDRYVYFIHSYVAYSIDDTILCMVSYYGTTFPALVVKKNIVGTQFHPEKSSKVGLAFLDTLYRWIKC